MNAFETELGVMNEIAQSVDDIGWLLPTDIQSDAIPLILGGGDVLMAAETGSGKTGAFCLPVIQIVYETLKEAQESKSASKDHKDTKKHILKYQMNVFDRTQSMAIDPEGLLCQSRDQSQWHGCRCAKGVINKGKYYYEATVTDEGLCRVGWSTPDASLDLGTDRFGFGFGGTGKKSNAKDFSNYGESYGINDTIGCFIDLDSMKIKWSKNGKDLGNAYDIPKNMQNMPFFAAFCCKNAEISFNFGEKAFKFPPKANEYIGLSATPKEFLADSKMIGSTVAPSQRALNAPLAIILEPSKELAEQTLKQVQNFKKHLKNPTIKELLVVGGMPVKDQIASLKDGVDIVVATPGRLDDLISSGSILLNQVRFLILDEVDGLLSQGHKDLIVKMYKQIPGVSQDGKRLQMIVCSATLHNFDVKKLADQIMHFPTWVDLKGQDSVPDTIHHCVCIIDPKVDLSWRNLKRQIKTDEVHANDKINFQNESKETLSEAIKILKAEYCVRAIQKFKMDRALIFCRTKIDCDNMENYFISLGGGPKTAGHQFSCVCLHADRSPNERTENLEKFKQNKVRLLICTDVAARGLDIGGLPFVINVTLPDDKHNYIHRIGRVGRAERMGLAISLVSKVQEKVWYHTCQSRGKNCYNTVLKEDGGCCIWYNEMQYLDDIEDHLGVTISQVPATFDIPMDEFDGKVVYGEKRQQQKNAFKGHVEFLAPTVKELFEFEKKAQMNYLNLKYFYN